MQTERSVGAAVALVITSIFWTAVAGAQVPQAELARSISHGDPYERFAAALQIREMGPGSASPALRDALVSALQEEAQRFLAYRRGEAPHVDIDLLGMLGLIVGEYRDPRALQALTDALGTGPGAARGLAAFGDPAVPYLVGVVRSDETPGVITDALLGLRFIAEGNGQIPLSPSSHEDLIAVARERMGPKQSSFAILVRAIDLAIALDEPELREFVEAMARDPSEVQSRLGYWTPRGIDRTVEWATERLNGVPPLPRW
jgi:hypothetical protein